MGLFTRTVLLLALVYLSISIGLGISEKNSDEVTAIDRLVAARNMRRTLAARTAFLDGGGVKNITDPNFRGDEDAQASTLDSAVPFYLGGLADGDTGTKSKRYRLEAKANAAEKAAASAASSSMGEYETLSAEVAALDAEIVKNISQFSTYTTDMQAFALQVRPYAEALKQQALNAIAAQASLYSLQAEKEALNFEKLNIRTRSVRADQNSAAVQRQIENMRREQTRISELLARYDRANPMLAASVDRNGTPWVDGVVTWAGNDSRAGMMKISIGSIDGVRLNQTLSIQRNGVFVARARVISLERNQATLRLEEQFLGLAKPLQGDAVSGSPNLGDSISRR